MLIQASAVKLLRTELLWVITQRVPLLAA